MVVPEANHFLIQHDTVAGPHSKENIQRPCLFAGVASLKSCGSFKRESMQLINCGCCHLKYLNRDHPSRYSSWYSLIISHHDVSFQHISTYFNKAPPQHPLTTHRCAKRRPERSAEFATYIDLSSLWHQMTFLFLLSHNVIYISYIYISIIIHTYPYISIHIRASV